LTGRTPPVPNSSPTLILIRREEGGDSSGHHGGAWKVAYADFVTAMMAFFLLMWLLNATTEEQRTGLADYFSPTNFFGRSVSGSGQPFGGSTPNDPGIAASSTGSPQVIEGRQPQSPDDEADDPAPDATPTPGDGAELRQGNEHQAGTKVPQPGVAAQALTLSADHAGMPLAPTPNAASAAPAKPAPAHGVNEADRERQMLDEAGAQLMEAIRHDPALQDAAGQLTIQAVPEGLRIQVVDAERRPMFALGGASPTPRVRELMRRVATVLAGLPNEISIAGHTDALTYRGQDRGNWELSSERANAVRRILAEAGLAESRVRSVTGNADRDLLMPGDPLNPANRRISIIVLRHTGANPTARSDS